MVYDGGGGGGGGGDELAVQGGGWGHGPDRARAAAERADPWGFWRRSGGNGIEWTHEVFFWCPFYSF